MTTISPPAALVPVVPLSSEPERCEGPVFLTPADTRPDRHGAWRIVRRTSRKAGLGKPAGPHTLRHAFIPPPSTPQSPCATSRKPHPTPTGGPGRTQSTPRTG